MPDVGLVLNVCTPQVFQSDEATGGKSLAESSKEALVDVRII